MNSPLLSSPFIRTPRQTKQIMALVLLCLVPGLLTQSYQFGWGSLIQVALAAACAVSSEALVLSIRKRAVWPSLQDHSALVTGVLIGLALPAYAPWWIAIIGSVFAIIIVKQLYGGLGNNPFNPAAAAYVLLLVSFPAIMTSWFPVKAVVHEYLSFSETLNIIFMGFSLDGFSLSQIINLENSTLFSQVVDGYSSATPLDLSKTQFKSGMTNSEIVSGNQFGLLAGLGWQWINLAYLIGGLALIYLKVIRWHLPLAFLGSLSLCVILMSFISPDQHLLLNIHWFSGATMLGAFFIITDPVTAATSNKGRLIYGSLIGVLVFIIRTWGGYPDGVAFAVLLANMCVPLIDHFTKPVVYGYHKDAANE